VYRECVSQFPPKLLLGVSTTFISYGQTGTGKTHSLLGEGRGAELSVLANPPSVAGVEGLAPVQQPSPDGTEGIIPRAVAHLFDLLYASTRADSSIEYTIRCSFVEIYLEGLTDLLQPGRREGLRVGEDENGDPCVVGATQLCCLCPEDVYALLARGHATRMKAAKDANMDSFRSHAVFTLVLEQVDKVAGEHSVSKMQIMDLAGSEARPDAITTNPSIATENRMINASLASFHKLVKWTLQKQQSPSSTAPTTALPRPSLSTLATLLQPSIGGNTYTAMLCTGSPSSYNINETVHTMQFGQLMRKVVNHPRAAQARWTPRSCYAQLMLAERRQQRLTSMIRLMALECKHGKKKSREPKNPKVWEAVLQIAEADRKANKDEGEKKKKKRMEAVDDANFTISIYNQGEEMQEIESLQAKVEKLESELQKERMAREKIQAKVRDVRSDLAALKSANESLLMDKRSLARELDDSKAENKVISNQKDELEHRLRTSQFRENEAILFLRQLRTFYFRLLKNKAAHGSGGTRTVIDEAKKRIPGVTDLDDLLDVDKMMIQSGIIESFEAGGDTLVGDHYPSEEALERSAAEAEKAAMREIELVRESIEVESDSQRKHHQNGKTTGSNAERVPDGSPSLNGYTDGQLAAHRQKLLLTPAGLLAIQKEQELERDLLELSKKFIGMQNAINAEKAMVEALSSRQGATTKLKQAQEVNILKQELELRTNDLHAIVWKMNELHLVNKMIDSKVMTREQKVKYLEDHISDMQSKTDLLIASSEKRETRLRDENTELKCQVDGMAVGLWQLGERTDKRPMWRLSVPYSSERVDLLEHSEHRCSNGKLTDEEIDGLVKLVEDTC
jgi:Kinesin motor domain